MKQHRDFVLLVRGNEDINALVATSRIVTTHATQDTPAFDTEHLTLVFIDPAGAGATTGEGLRNSIKVQIDVPPVDKGQHFGWKDFAEDRIEGSPREVVEAVQFGAASEEIARLRKDLADSENETKAKDVTIANLEQQIAEMGTPKTLTVPQPDGTFTAIIGTPSAADLDAVAAEDAAKGATAGEAQSNE